MLLPQACTRQWQIMYLCGLPCCNLVNSYTRQYSYVSVQYNAPKLCLTHMPPFIHVFDSPPECFCFFPIPHKFTHHDPPQQTGQNYMQPLTKFKNKKPVIQWSMATLSPSLLLRAFSVKFIEPVRACWLPFINGDEAQIFFFSIFSWSVFANLQDTIHGCTCM